MFFVNQKKHNSSNDTWDNNAHTKATWNEVMHQFHAFMSTYGYGYAENIDYVSCSVESLDGGIRRNEVDDRIPTPEPEVET